MMNIGVGEEAEMELLRCFHLRTKMPFLTLVPHVMRFFTILGTVITLSAAVSFPSITVAQENYAASEFIEENIQNQMSSADIVALLNQTVGNVTGTNRAVGQPLRRGLLVTATPKGSNIILRFEVER